MIDWVRLAPVERVNYGASIKAWLKQRRDGSSTLSVTISQLLAESFAGDLPTCCEAYHGAGDDAGKLMLKFGAGGDVAVSKIGRGGLRILLPKPPNLVIDDSQTDTCQFIEKTADAIVFRLPTAFWRKPDAKLAAAEAPAKRPGSELEKLDAAAYLQKQGRKCSKLADGTYRYEGEPRSPASMLSLVNHFRNKAGLGSLTLLDLA